MIRVVFVTSGLGMGGAEMVLFNLLRELDPLHFNPIVISLTGCGPVSELLTASGFEVYNLDFYNSPIRNFFVLVHLLRRLRPSIIQTWMYHGDLLGSLAARAAGLRRIVWSIHNLELDSAARMTAFVRNICGRLSGKLPQVILCCSEASAAYHQKIGYSAARMICIPNGFDTRKFKPDPASRAEVRAQLGVPESAALIVNVGRMDPLKNQAGFLRAAAIVAARVPDSYFLMVGKGVDPYNSSLAELAKSLGISERVAMLGPRSDISALLASSDILVQTSFSEAFPMVLGEAMSCGVPCVASNVGDTALIVADTGFTFPVGDDASAANAIANLLNMSRRERTRMGNAARNRIVNHFDIRLIASQYAAIYFKIAGEDMCAG
jgi:glycosyltransferase involved in cell wall biosynthesis